MRMSSSDDLIRCIRDGADSLTLGAAYLLDITELAGQIKDSPENRAKLAAELGRKQELLAATLRQSRASCDEPRQRQGEADAAAWLPPRRRDLASSGCHEGQPDECDQDQAERFGQPFRRTPALRSSRLTVLKLTP
jgi:hypothetical protein